MRTKQSKSTTATMLRVWREQKDLSQGDVAAMLGLTTAQSVSNIERGIAPLPAKHIATVSALYDVPATDIIAAMIADETTRLLRAANYHGRKWSRQ